MKRSSLRRRTELKSGNGLRRTGIKRNPPRNKGVEFTETVKRRVRERSGDRCEANLVGCTGSIEQFHHRKMRSQGGKGTLSNCLGSCHRCHRWIHDHTAWSYEHGFLVRSHLEPWEVKLVRPQ